MTENSISAQASVAPDVATQKRSIQMKMFATKADHAEVAYKNAPKVLGQLLGMVATVQEKVGTLPDGTSKTSLLAIGEFEGINYETGEVFTSGSAYLPNYYAETVKAILATGGLGLTFAIEIVLVPTGKNIPTAYEVRNLIQRRPDSPINRLKQEMAQAGRLRLPPPVQAPDDGTTIALSAPAGEASDEPDEPVATDEADADHAPNPATEAPIAHGRARGKAGAEATA